MALLVQELQQQTSAQLQALAQLPAPPTYRFDTAASPLPVLKSRARQVRSAQHGAFVAVEVLRTDPDHPQAPPQRSPALSRLVPRHSSYAFDLIAQVGQQVFLESQRLAQVRQTFQDAPAPLSIPLSTLQDLKMKFLFYLGLLHQQAAPQLQQSLAWFEQAHQLFERFRSALRLAATGPCPVHDAYALAAPDVVAMHEDLAQLRQDLRRQQEAAEGSAQERKLGRIVLTHLDRYWTQLDLTEGGPSGSGLRVRTTNAMETHWTQGKRQCRQIHGRSQLTRDFRALPAEFMLVPNLRQESYQQLVLGGGLDHLAQKFADLRLPEGGFQHWRQQQHPERCGSLPKRMLREENFPDKLLSYWPNPSQAS